MAKAASDLGVTALYTAATWHWGRLQNSSLFMHPEAARVFGVTNAALRFASFFGNKAPSLPCGLVQRHTMLDAALSTSGAGQVIELAAGLSRRGATFSVDPSLSYTEVDRPHVVEKKRALLQRTPEGRAVLQRHNLHLVGQDVLTPLSSLSVRTEAKLAVIAEGLFVYLNAGEQEKLCQQVRELMTRAGSGCFLFDFVPWPEQPRGGLLSRALDRLLRRTTSSAGFVRDERPRQAILEMLRDAGFRTARALSPSEAEANWTVPFLDQPTQQLVFLAEA